MRTKTGQKMMSEPKTPTKTLPRSFEGMFHSQINNQRKMIDSGMYDRFADTDGVKYMVPYDDIGLFSYHMQQLQSEIGEVLEADKRWKNFRNVYYDREHKKEEIADCFIVLMNIAMFSGINADEMSESIYQKIKSVSERISASK